MAAIFHIVDRDVWRAAVVAGEYRPASLESEGFVHCSFAEQVPGTLARYYSGIANLLVVELDGARLTDVLRVEDTTGRGEAFPHVYAPIPIDAAIAEHDCPASAPGGG
ncbi:MAG: DUF952 domain-containing protein [Actinomycetota bacterium]